MTSEARQPGPPTMVTATDIHKTFGNFVALDGVSITVRRGEAKFIIGPSGCGKSTFLRCLNLLEEPTSGRIEVGQTAINFGEGRPRLSARTQAAYRRNIGMVFQQFHLFPHLTVIENVCEGPVTVKGQRRSEARRAAMALLEKVGLADKADASPRQLSGGQQQRVAIARALAMQPDVMLFDEPTSALDPELVGEVLEVIRALTREGVTMVVVTHEMSFARDVATEVVFMNAGRVLAEGSPDAIFCDTDNPRLKAFLSRLQG